MITYTHKLLTSTAATLLLSLASLGEAQAETIHGSISFDGSFQSNTSSLLTATFFSVLGGAVSGGADGDFAGTDGTVLTGQSLVFDPLTPLPTLFSFTSGGASYSFGVTSIASLDRVDFGAGFGAALFITGDAIIRRSGFEDTLATWWFAGQSIDSREGTWNGGFDADGIGAPVVPDNGMTLTLLGGGLLGAAALRRRLAGV